MSHLSDLGFNVRGIDVLGVRVDDVTLDEAVAICRRCIRSGQSHRVVTPNAEIVMAARDDPGFRKTLNTATLAIPDGAGLLLAGRLLGTLLRAQVAGTDLADRIAALCAVDGYRLFLLGAGARVADEAARQLQRRHPGLVIAGTYAGDADASADGETRVQLSQAGPIDVVFVAFGAKRQEFWIERNQAELGIPLAIGVGGVFDFFAGRVPRAPVWIRRAGFDWLFRLTLQPWRWRRQLALPRFVVATTIAGVTKRLGDDEAREH
jgi:N-acetylglucosaminyldiphosphoundecaprenol N-acetyl-beta-D-mannosaminyltransferase